MRTNSQFHPKEKGVSLIVILVILTTVSAVGVGSAQLSLWSEKGTRNARDRQIALQSAELALLDAEIDIRGPNTASSQRLEYFDNKSIYHFEPNCGTSSTKRGLCAYATSGKPVWASVDFMATGSSAPTVEYGEYTGRSFSVTGAGVAPAKKPRYIIEAIPDTSQNELGLLIYRVTAMGFGQSEQTQVILQIEFRKEQ